MCGDYGLDAEVLGLHLLVLEQNVRGSKETRPIIDCPGDPVQRMPLSRMQSAAEPALDSVEGLRPHGAVKGRGDKEGACGLGLGHGTAPLLHSVWR